MKGSADWARLIEALNSWTSATETAPGRIEVSLPQTHGNRRVTIVMTPPEWEHMTSVMWGNLEDAVEDVKRTLRGLRRHEDYAVFSQYQLEPSTEPTLPEPAEFVPQPGGRWVAYDHEGRIVSRFTDRSEPDERH